MSMQEEGTPGSAPQEQSQGSRSKLLFIEDEAVLRELATDALAKTNVDITPAARGEDVLVEDVNGGGYHVPLDFDIVVTDHDLSKAGGVLTGPQIIKIIVDEYEKAGKLPPYCIGYSSRLNADLIKPNSVRDEFIAAGAKDVLAKPYKPKVLAEKISTGIATRPPKLPPAPPAK